MKSTDVKGKGRVVNHVPKLIEEYAGGKDRVNLTVIAEMVGLNPLTVRKWYLDQVQRADAESLIAWCFLFGCTINDLWEYVPPKLEANAG